MFNPDPMPCEVTAAVVVAGADDDAADAVDGVEAAVDAAPEMVELMSSTSRVR
jgi:hypothetical protein